METTIRKAIDSDAEAISVFIRKLNWFPNLDSDPDCPMEHYVKKHLSECVSNDSHSIYIAENENKEVVAYISVHWLPYLIFKGHDGFVSELFVLEEARGNGIGGRLLDAAKKEATERGCIRLNLLNDRTNDSYKRSFYAGNGFFERKDMANFIFSFPEA